MKGNAVEAQREADIQRNPHGNFKEVEAGRPAYNKSDFIYTKTPDPDWKAGSGSNDLEQANGKDAISIDPYEEGRPAAYNYKLLISGITPRPIGFISSLGSDGPNLAPFSYTQVVDHDPPMFVVGFAGSIDSAKDTLKNILETEEFVINMVSEHFVEAMNFTSINAPRAVDEWQLSGLTPSKSVKVRPARVQESIFSIECKLNNKIEWQNKDGKKTGVTIFGEGIMFHVRQDALNESKNLVDPNVLKPVGRLGGISYTVVDKAFEIPRPDFDQEMQNEVGSILKSKDKNL